MKHDLRTYTTLRLWFALALVTSLSLPQAVLAATIALATAPMTTSSTTSVLPNVMFLLDNSGSMGWDHMPDDSTDGGSAVTYSYGYYGIRSSQCNQVYYDPNTTYLAPVDSTGLPYADATFTSACADGFSGSCSVNLNTSFKANQAGVGGNAGGTDSSGGPAYYYSYSGSQLSQQQKDVNSTSSTYYNECHSARYASTGDGVFTRISLSTTAAATTATIVASCSSCSTTAVSSIKVNGTEEILSASTTGSATTTTVATAIAAKINLCTSAKVGNCTTTGGHGYTATVSGSTVTITGLNASSTSLIITQSGSMTLSRTIFPIANTAQLTNFANWYSYYRTRMMMMKTAAGRAFKSLDSHYRVGFTKLSSSSTPTVYVDTFTGTQRTNWYSSLYGSSPSGSTPLREALADAGRYYAHKESGADPMQYSCQQNFTIMSTDGFWNGNAGYQLDGSSAVGNQDGTAARAQYDGALGATKVKTTYTQNSYSQGTSGASGCSGSKHKLKTQPQIFSCSVTTVNGVSGAETCTSPTNNGSATYTGLCLSSVTLPSPNPSTRMQSGTPVTTTTTVGGTSDTLADVAMYYYQTDLRTSALNNCTGAAGVDVCTNNVFKTPTDSNVSQHMSVFTLGMGANGRMAYSPSYPTDNNGDYFSVLNGSTAHPAATPPVCAWQADNTTCNWPVPGMDGSGNGYIENIDDLWHAAVDGHGQYFSATSPTSLSSGLSSALASISARRGAASAAATSTLSPVPGNNYVYFASYTTVKWTGNLEARTINVTTGDISDSATWCVENVVAGICADPSVIITDNSGGSSIPYCVTSGSTAATCTAPGVFDSTTSDCKVPLATSCTGTMQSLVAANSDTRAIYTANSAGTALVDFLYPNLKSTDFDAAHIGTLSQWSSLTATQKTAAVGANLVNFLRGQTGYEDRAINLVGAVDNRIYRAREATMGDALESQPIFIGPPVFAYTDPGYSQFLTANSSRPETVYLGTNDGMLHAFSSNAEGSVAAGTERWAYVPSIVISNMWKLADKDYANKHTNFVNGSAIVTDVCTAHCDDSSTAVWRSILVGGLGGGGRGYYALDVTNPKSPVLLWEFTAAQDSDLGFTFGEPVITSIPDTRSGVPAGTMRWVVALTSGYDNGTDSPTPVTPATSPVTYVPNSPAGSGQGYLYILDAGTGTVISKTSTGVGTPAAPSGLAKISAWNDSSGFNRASYIYGGDLLGNVWRFDLTSAAAPVLFAQLMDPSGVAQPVTTAPVLGRIAGNRMIFIGTGKYLEPSDLNDTQVQSIYAIMDDNTATTLSNPAGSPRISTTLVQQTLVDQGNGTRTLSNNPVDYSLVRGWYVDLPGSGERVNIKGKLDQGVLVYATLVPSNSVCSPGGTAWANFFNYETGSSVNPGDATASGAFDNPIVGINMFYLGGQAVWKFIDSTGNILPPPGGPSSPGLVSGFNSQRVLWREFNPQ